MPQFLSEWHLIIRRSLANWRLLSTLMVGVLVAVALLSSAPFFSNAINDLGLHRALREKQIELMDMQVYQPFDVVRYQDYVDSSNYVNTQVNNNISSIIREQETWIQSQSYFAGWAGQPMPTGSMRPTGFFQIFSNLEDHIELLDGKYAEPVADGLTQEQLEDPDFAIQGMIGSDSAAMFHVGVGDRLVFVYGYGVDERRLNIEISGIIDPIDLSEEFWLLKTDVFTRPSDEGEVAPIFIPEQTFFQGVAKIFPATRAQYYWLYYVDIEKIDSQNVGSLKNSIDRMDRQLIANLPKSGMMTLLDTVIHQYQDKLMYTQIPLFLIISQIVAIILYYLITVANMLIERQSGEIALLRSRGASTRQIIGIYFMEGLTIAGCRSLTVDQVCQLLDGVPSDKLHCVHVVLRALANALDS